jgi:6-phosphogluconolactonase
MAEPELSQARVVVARDLAGAARLLAQEVVARAQAAVALRARFTLALSGGHTPQALHALLADPEEPFRSRIAWAATDVFFGDERCVGPDHPESNYGAARASLLARVPLPEANVHRLRGEDDPPVAAAAYEAELRRAVPSERGLPCLDLVLLGLGADGHTASLFPGTAALEEETRLVVANEVPQVGGLRLTFTFKLIGAARAVAFFVAGEEKAAAVADVLEGRDAPPAARVRLAHGDLAWFLDEAAASRLPAAMR